MNTDNSIFGKMEFHTGWKTQSKIAFCEQTYPITIKCKSYRQEDGLTQEQKEAMELYARDGQKQLSISQPMPNTALLQQCCFFSAMVNIPFS